MGPSNEVGPPAGQPGGTDTTNTNSAQRNGSARQQPAAAGYAAAFGIYHQRGWPVMPLPKARKKRPPKGFTGRDGAVPSYADMLAWADEITATAVWRFGCRTS